MRLINLFIAMSLDGFISGPEDDLSWLSTVETHGEDYGYGDFIRSIDTVIMGRKTYDKVLSFGIQFPHKERKCYVVSRTRQGFDENVEYYNGNIQDLIEHLKSKDGGQIFCDGGSEIVFELMKAHLIDRYIISVIPVLLGNGTSLFKPGRDFKQLKLSRSITFPSGLVQLWYDKV